MKVKLGDVFELQMGKTPSRNNSEYWNGEHNWVSISDLGNSGKYINKTKECITDKGIIESGIKRVPKNTVLMSFKLSIGKVSIAAEEIYTNEAIMAFIDKEKCMIDSSFLYYLFSGIDWTAGSNKAVMGITLNKATISQKKIYLPPLDEQRHIAAVLDKVSDLIALRKKQLAKLDELVKARFVEMFGDPVLNTKKMDIVYLLDIAEYYNGLTYKPENIKDNGVIILRSSNIKNNHLNFDDIVRVDCNIKARLFVRENDILMCSRNGSSRLVGKVALVDNLFEPMGFGAFMMIVRSSYYSYLLIYFQLEAFRRQIRTGATTTINQITGAMLDKVMLPIPDQDSLESFNIFYKKIKKYEYIIKNSLSKMETLKKSLMQEYFG